MSYRLAPALWAPVVALSLAIAAPARADLVSSWNLIAIDQINAAGGAVAGTNRAPRVLAIYHLAIYDALANIEKTHAPYGATIEPPEGVVTQAAILGAAHWTLSVFLPARRSQLNALLDAALDALPPSDAIDASVDYGKEIAATLIDARASDGSLATTAYTAGTGLGAWYPVDETAAEAAVEPFWANVTPFALESAEQFRPAAPPELTSDAYIAAVEQVRTLGAAANTSLTTHTRTAEQTEIATLLGASDARAVLRHRASGRERARAHAR